MPTIRSGSFDDLDLAIWTGACLWVPPVVFRILAGFCVRWRRCGTACRTASSERGLHRGRARLLGTDDWPAPGYGAW